MDENIRLVNFTELTNDEKKMVLNWRNHHDIRKWMYTQEEIDLKSHLNFIESLKSSTDKLYFLVKKGTEPIGVIDFTNIDRVNKSTYFGLYANPDCSIPGIGRILEAVSIDYAFNTLGVKTLKLEVFHDNVQVRNLHRKFKFKETGSKTVNNKKVICMELENENR